jgi:multiple sugar transport system substrate-binding protein
MSIDRFRASPFSRRVFGIALVGFVLGALISSCRANQPPVEPVSLRFAIHQRDEEHYLTLAQKFEDEHPFIKIELVSGNNGFLNNLQPGDADVFALSTDQMRRMLAQGNLLGLTPFMAEDQSFDRIDFYPGTLELLNAEGEAWGIPLGMDLYAMFYNRDLFDQAGLPYPAAGWNWDQFLDYAYAITQPDDPSNPIYGYCPISGYQDTFALVYALGGRLVDDIQKPTTTTFDDPLTIEAMEFYTRLFQEWGVAPLPEILQRYYGGNDNAFFEILRRGNVGMWVFPLSNLGFLRQFSQQDFDVGVAPMPAEFQSFSPIWVDEAYVISAATSHLDESWEWINFLSYQIHPGRVPARVSLIESQAFRDGLGGDTADLVLTVMENATPISLWYLMDLGEQLDYFSEAVELMITGEQEPADALIQAQEQASEVSP